MDTNDRYLVIAIVAIILAFAAIGTVFYGSYSVSKSIENTNTDWDGIAADLNEYGGTVTYARTFASSSYLETATITAHSSRYVETCDAGLILHKADGSRDIIAYSYITVVHINK